MSEVIYVSGPYSKGDVCENIRNACLAGDEILQRGHTPFIPHLTHLWHLISPKPYIEWMRIDVKLLSGCDALLRLPGESNGADLEVDTARALGIKVYSSIEEIENGGS